MEEIEKTLSPTITFVNQIVAFFQSLVDDLFTIPQAIAVSVTLLIAALLYRMIARRMEPLVVSIGNPLLRRSARAAQGLTFPIIWVVGLWISLTVLHGFSARTGTVRLFASLINAWVLIRILSIFIPSHFWAKVFAWFAWTVAALNAFGVLDPFIRWMDDVGFTFGDVTLTVWDVVQGILIIGLLIWLAITLSRLIQMQIDRAQNLTPSIKVLAGKVLRLLLIGLAVVFGLSAIGVDLTAFAVFSGALGLGVGLGLQRTIGNLVAGFTMLADRSIKPGDVIEVDTGDGPTYGEVKTLNTRYISVRTRSGKETLIPNDILISNPVINWSYSDKVIRQGIPVGVAYSTDVDKAMDLCVEAAKSCARVLKSPSPVCLVKGFGDSSVDLELRYWINDPEGGVANSKSAVYLAIWHRFREHEIEIPFPQLDLHLRSGLPPKDA